MNLEIGREQAEDLDGLLGVSIGELSHEIAATDNPGYRAQLVARRDRLTVFKGQLEHLLAPRAPVPGGLVRELARPGG
jgi:hypothetical protein